MKILITGIGITGKSTFRRTLKKLISLTGLLVKDVDGDYEEVPEKFEEEIVYIIEDVHGLMKSEEVCLLLDNYDLVIYLLPTLFSHLIFWLKRIWTWSREGKGSWDKKRQGWLGSGRKYNPRNILLFIDLMVYDFRNRRKWINQDIETFSHFKNLVIIQPQWIIGGIKFNLIHRF